MISFTNYLLYCTYHKSLHCTVNPEFLCEAHDEVAPCPCPVMTMDVITIDKDKIETVEVNGKDEIVVVANASESIEMTADTEPAEKEIIVVDMTTDESSNDPAVSERNIPSTSVAGTSARSVGKGRKTSKTPSTSRTSKSTTKKDAVVVASTDIDTLLVSDIQGASESSSDDVVLSNDTVDMSIDTVDVGICEVTASMAAVTAVGVLVEDVTETLNGKKGSRKRKSTSVNDKENEEVASTTAVSVPEEIVLPPEVALKVKCNMDRINIAVAELIALET